MKVITTYILLTCGENNDFEITCQGIEELFGEGPDIEYHLESQVLQLLLGRLASIFRVELACELVQVVLLLLSIFENLLVLHM